MQADGTVRGQFAFAAAELGAVRDDLATFVVRGTDVTADGASCTASYEGAAPAPPDGVVLAATYACPPGAEEIAVTLYYLAELPPGHRQVTRIDAPGPPAASAEGVLSAERRGLSLRLPDDGRRAAAAAARQKRSWALGALGAVAAALVVAVAAATRRAAARRPGA